MIFRPSHPRAQPSAHAVPDQEELAAQAFAQRCLDQGKAPWTDAEEIEFSDRLARDQEFADAFHRVERSWEAVGPHALSPELMALREQAISRARRSNARRWLGRRPLWRPLRAWQTARVTRIAAGIAVLSIALTAAYTLAPFGLKRGEYRTDIGEQRSVELEDHSRITLDAATRLKVRYSDDARIITLIDGQAQFSVAKDPTRPFKVEAGRHTVVALGTVFTVEYIDHAIHIAMLEGRVAVTSVHSAVPRLEKEKAYGGKNEKTSRRGVAPSSTFSTRTNSEESSERNIGEDRQPVELTAGEAMHVAYDGHAVVTTKADIEAATAWREGKVIFHNEPLSEAVRRLNRYSQLQLEVDDPKLSAMHISGVFDAGDAIAFAEAVQTYLPTLADYTDPDRIRLKARY